MRLTRAAQRAQQNIDEPVDATDQERAPLNEISHNATPELAELEESMPMKTPAKTPAKKGKKGGVKKGAKGKKGKAIEDEEQIQVVTEDERRAAASPASDAAMEDPAKGPVDNIVQVPINDEQPASPPSRAVRLTRRQLAMQEEQSKQSQRAPSLLPQPEHNADEATEEALVTEAAVEFPEHVSVEQLADTKSGAEHDEVGEPIEDSIPEPETLQEEELVKEQKSVGISQSNVTRTGTEEAEKQEPEIAATDTKHVEEDETELAKPEIEAQETELAAIKSEPTINNDQTSQSITPLVEIASNPEPMTLSAEEPYEDALTPTKKRTSRRISHNLSKSPVRIEESLEAIDALEEALENVGKVLQDCGQSADEVLPDKSHLQKTTNTTRNIPTKTPGKAPLPIRVSKNPSIAPQSIKPTNTLIARAPSVRAVSSKDARKSSAGVTDYLALKRRPISMSFPTPPPPLKSTRPPTKPTFQLSSDVVAAKLKAQKEERAKREAEVVAPKQRPISMPPPPRSTKPPTKSNFQLPGEATAAKLKAQKEERLKRAAEGTAQPKARPTSMLLPSKSTKPPTKSNFQLPGEAIAAKLRAQKEERQKRGEEADAARKAASKVALARKPSTMSIRQTSATRPQPGVTIPPPPLAPPAEHSIPSAQRSSSSLVSKRSSFIASESRSTSISSVTRASIVTPSDVVAQKVKGREIFNKDKVEQEARERERREKEDAAKKAREEAAERGRVASREWAERQRKKMVDAVKGMKEGWA